MSATSSTLNAILASLVAGFGEDAVKQACASFALSKPIVPSPILSSLPGKKGKKEKKVSFSTEEGEKVEKVTKPRGKSSWNILVDEVLAEMKIAEPSTTRRVAMAEASRRRRQADPELQTRYEEYKAKKAEKKAEKQAKKAAGEAVSSSSSEAGSSDDE